MMSLPIWDKIIIYKVRVPSCLYRVLPISHHRARYKSGSLGKGTSVGDIRGCDGCNCQGLFYSERRKPELITRSKFGRIQKAEGGGGAELTEGVCICLPLRMSYIRKFFEWGRGDKSGC